MTLFYYRKFTNLTIVNKNFLIYMTFVYYYKSVFIQVENINNVFKFKKNFFVNSHVNITFSNINIEFSVLTSYC
ncbi:Hypothetical protein ERWE_CDS_04210 [Ehrlichia ruminantium str. Welgevonden]|uniref:Uncharacterized protein n=1 Tax=Ehrlichia ruminantium (strain Welgevonden) TaxID=254945 RepID=A0A0H3LZT5_EHRRW|nr:Hypothetical protein ERWE_CDS_04210 [Ehrlichia ruminantium str. Welgevonden]